MRKRAQRKCLADSGLTDVKPGGRQYTLRHDKMLVEGIAVGIEPLEFRHKVEREIRFNLVVQQALNPCSRTQSSAPDGSPACCTSLMLRLCVMLRVPSQYSVRSLLVLLLCKQRCSSCCLVGPSCLGHYRPLQRRSASDKCSVRCRPIKQRENLTQLLIKTYLR